MKIYASVDMEGIAGILLPEQLRRGELFYQEGRECLTREVNALVEALVEQGATEIVVKDAHGTGFNFIPAKLHPAARYVMGATRMDIRFPGLDRTFDGAMLIGYHAMAGTSEAVRDHTMTSADWQGVWLNGREVGEIALDALWFGLHGVPVLLVTGDDKACLEARTFLGDQVVTLQTKQGVARHAAIIRAPEAVYAQYPAVVRDALASVGENRKPYTLDSPFEIVIRYTGTHLLDGRYFDGVSAERLDGVTARYRDDDLLRLLSRAF